MAARAKVGVGTFTRRFRDEVGASPGRWLGQQRIERARYLLESRDRPVDTVAARAGLGTGGSLRRHLRTAVGVSPHAYRRTPTAAPSARHVRPRRPPPVVRGMMEWPGR